MSLENVTSLFERGGPAMYVLAVCAVALVTVILDRAWLYGHVGHALQQLLDEKLVPEWFLTIIRATAKGKVPADEQRYETGVLSLSQLLSARLSILATVGAIAPFIGLLGTVLGVMNSFEAMSIEKSAGIDVVGAGIAEALLTTAAGLTIGIVAVVAYNVFRTWAGRMQTQLDLAHLEQTAGSANSNRTAVDQ